MTTFTDASVIEALRWAGPALVVPGAAIGIASDADATWFVGHSATDSVLRIARVHAESWPPELEDVGRHAYTTAPHVFECAPISLGADGEVAFGAYHCAFSTKRAANAAISWTGARLVALGPGGLYTARGDGDRVVIEHRSERSFNLSGRSVLRVRGDLSMATLTPLDGGCVLAFATPHERLVLHRVDANGAARTLEPRSDRVAAGPRNYVVPRRGGAWWVSGPTAGGAPIHVQALVGDDLVPEAPPYVLPAERYDRPLGACALGDKLVVLLGGPGVALVVTDGVSAIRSEGRMAHATSNMNSMCVAAAHDGEAVWVVAPRGNDALLACAHVLHPGDARLGHAPYSEPDPRFSQPSARSAPAHQAIASSAASPRSVERPAPDAVLEAPRTPSVDPDELEAELTALLENAVTRVAAGETTAALKVILEAFRLTRHPRIADLLDTAPVPRSYRRPTDAIERLLASEPTDDPRASRLALDALVEPKSINRRPADVERSEDIAAAMLVASRDIRFRDALADRIARGRPFAALDPVPPSLHVALEVLDGVSPVELGAANEARVHRLEDALAARKHVPGARPIRDLLQAVYDDPRNGALRDELATRLVDVGDPRGEFIRLQRARSASEKKPTKREKDLLDEHATAWLGEIAPVIAEDEVFRDGFVWRATTGMRHAPLTHPVGAFPLLVSTGPGLQPEWSTLEHLSLFRHFGQASGVLGGPRLQGLRELTDIGPGDLGDLANGPQRPLEILELGMPRNEDLWSGHYADPLQRALENLPRLHTARLSSGALTPGALEKALAGATALRRLAVGVLDPPALGRLLTLADAMKLESIAMLSYFDVRYDLGAKTAEVELSRRFHPQFPQMIANELRSLEGAGLARVVVRHAPKATIANVDDRGQGPVLSSKGKHADLTPVWNAARDLGAEAVFAPAVAHWSRSTVRDE